MRNTGGITYIAMGSKEASNQPMVLTSRLSLFLRRLGIVTRRWHWVSPGVLLIFYFLI